MARAHIATMRAAGQALAFIRENPGVVIDQVGACVPLSEACAIRAVNRLRREGRIAWSKELHGWVAVEPVGANPRVRPTHGERAMTSIAPTEPARPGKAALTAPPGGGRAATQADRRPGDPGKSARWGGER